MNSGDINEMLGRVLQNPEALSGIMKLAQGLMNGGGEGVAPRPQQSTQSQSTTDASETSASETQYMSEGDMREAISKSDLPRLFAHDENRTRLLSALKPYLGKGRREKVDYILNILRLMELAGSANLIPHQ